MLIGYSSPLTLHAYGPGWVRLEQQLPVQVGDVLMVHQEFSAHPRTLMLRAQLLDHLTVLAADQPDVVIHRNVTQPIANSTSAN